MVIEYLSKQFDSYFVKDMSAHSKSNDIHVYNDDHFISLEVKNK